MEEFQAFCLLDSRRFTRPLSLYINIKIKGALSRDASRTIIKKLATSNSLHDSTVASIPSFDKTDLAKLLTYTEGNPKLKEQVETVLFLAKIGITG